MKKDPGCSVLHDRRTRDHAYKLREVQTGFREKLSPLRLGCRGSDYPGSLCSSNLGGSSPERAQPWAALSDLGAEHICLSKLLFHLDLSCNPWMVNAHSYRLWLIWNLLLEVKLNTRVFFFLSFLCNRQILKEVIINLFPNGLITDLDLI